MAVVGSILALKDMYPDDTWKTLYNGFDAMIDKVNHFYKPMMSDLNNTGIGKSCTDLLDEDYNQIMSASGLLRNFLITQDPFALENFMDSQVGQFNDTVTLIENIYSGPCFIS